MEEKVLDLRSYTTLCGDYSVHILSALEELPEGARLRVIVPKDAQDLLEEAVENIVAAGVAEKAGEGVEDGAYYVILRRK